MYAAPDLPSAYKLIALDRVDSTNEEAKRRARAGAADGTVVWALEQSAGRGRGGRRWVSPRGNLYCSVVTRPDCALMAAAQLGFAACLGVGAMLRSLAPPDTELHYKWPNDVLLNGRKAAGILLETSTAPEGELEWLVVGVGVNVANCPRDSDKPATSLAAVGAGAIQVASVLEGFLRHFSTWAERWRDEGFEPLRAAWIANAKGVGEPIQARFGEHRMIEGVFQGLNERGALVLTTTDGRPRTVEYGEVTLAAAGV